MRGLRATSRLLPLPENAAAPGGCVREEPNDGALHRIPFREGARSVDHTVLLAPGGGKLTIALMPSSVRRTHEEKERGVDGRTRVYVAALAAVTCAVLGSLIITQSLSSDAWAVAGLAVVAAVAERGRVRLTERHEESISLLPTLFAAVLAGPAAGFVVGVASFAFDFRRPYARWGTYTCTRAISGAGAGAVAAAFGVPKGASFQGILLVTLLAAITIEGLDALFLTLTGAVRMAYSRPWDIKRKSTSSQSKADSQSNL